MKTFIFLLLTNLFLLNVYGQEHICSDIKKLGITQENINFCKDLNDRSKSLDQYNKRLKKENKELNNLKYLVKRFKKLDCRSIKTKEDAKKMPVRSCQTDANIKKYGLGNVSVCCEEIKNQNLRLAKKKIDDIERSNSTLQFTVETLVVMSQDLDQTLSGKCTTVKCIIDSKDFFKKRKDISKAETFANEIFTNLKSKIESKESKKVAEKFDLNKSLNDLVLSYCEQLAKGLDLSSQKDCRAYVNDLELKLSDSNLLKDLYSADEFRVLDRKCNNKLVSKSFDVYQNLDSLDINRIGVLSNQCRYLKDQKEYIDRFVLDVLRESKDKITALKTFLNDSDKYCDDLEDLFRLRKESWKYSVEQKNEILQNVCEIDKDKPGTISSIEITDPTEKNNSSLKEVQYLMGDGLLTKNKFIREICDKYNSKLFLKEEDRASYVSKKEKLSPEDIGYNSGVVIPKEFEIMKVENNEDYMQLSKDNVMIQCHLPAGVKVDCRPVFFKVIGITPSDISGDSTKQNELDKKAEELCRIPRKEYEKDCNNDSLQIDF